MNPPSLREICARATKGPWRINPDAAFPGVWSGSLDDERELVASPLGDSPTVQANAQLIARFSPETALAVYEALENSERVLRGAALTIEDFSPYKSESAARKAVLEQADNVKATARLLDGRTEP